MGLTASTGWRAYKDPETTPDVQKPELFDAMYGFPNGRKKRVMKITEEEMNDARVPHYARDYCAHYAVKHQVCQRQYRPLASVYCETKKHAVETCLYEDAVLRMKEFERERRLLIKERRLKQKMVEENQGNNNGNGKNGKENNNNNHQH